MSTPSKGNPTPSSTKKIACESKININSKIHREVGKNTIYYLSKVSWSSVDYLVDGGADSDVAGNNVRVIAKHPDTTVVIRGIDNNEIIDVLLMNAGGVTPTTKGDVSVIMNQCAYHGKNKNIHSSS